MTAASQSYYKDQDPVDLAGELQKGQAVMAQYLADDDDKWYRARIEKVVQVGGVDKVDVVFIEFGNTERVFPHQVGGGSAIMRSIDRTYSKKRGFGTGSALPFGWVD